MNRFKAVIFDLGSTLIYFDGDWMETLQVAGKELLRSLRMNGLDLAGDFIQAFGERMDNYYRERETEFVEYTMMYILNSLLAEKGYAGVTEDVIRSALDAFFSVTERHWRTDEETIPTLRYLREQGYRLGMISNAGDDADVQRLVDQAELRSYFDIILTSAAEGIRKPNPRIFQKVLDYWDLAAGETLMVGDTLGADILGARNAGIFSVWLTRWAETPANRAHVETIHPDAAIARLSELPPLMERQ